MTGWMRGAACDQPFGRDWGLCSNLDIWLRNNIESSAERMRIRIEMHDQFRAAGLSVEYPFNLGVLDYVNECEREGCCLNHSRILWVETRIAECQ